MQTAERTLQLRAMPTMKCPACGAVLDAPAAACPECRFTLHRLDPKFGTLPLRNRYLTDRAQALSLEEVARLRELLQRFENRFPQSLFSVFVTDLPPDTNVREYAFWLANRAHFSSVESEAADNLDLLLVIDPAHHAAALTIGYGLEEFVTEENLRDALAAAENALRRNQLERAIRICVVHMTRHLCKASRTAERAHKFGDQLSIEQW